MLALRLNPGTRSLSLGYSFSKCGEFAFEAAFAVAIVSITDADMLLIGIAYFFVTCQVWCFRHWVAGWQITPTRNTHY